MRPYIVCGTAAKFSCVYRTNDIAYNEFIDVSLTPNLLTFSRYFFPPDNKFGFPAGFDFQLHPFAKRITEINISQTAEMRADASKFVCSSNIE